MDGTKNALAPLEFIVSVAGSLMLFFLVLSVPLIVFGSGSFLGVGEREVCLVVPSSAVHLDINGTNGARVEGLAPGGTSYPETVSVCQQQPSTRQRSLSVLVSAPDYLYSLGFVFLTWRLIRLARRRGFFVPDTALGVGRLGLYLLFGALIVAVVQAVASSTLLTTLADPMNSAQTNWMRFFHLSWAILFAGFGLLTIGRVMAQSVRLQREVDATV